MLISLKELPLAATLLGSFIFGFALAKLTQKPCLQVSFKPSKVLIPLRKDQFRLIDLKRVYSNQKVMLLRYDQDKIRPDCLETEKYGLIRMNHDSYFVEVSKSASKPYWKLMSHKNFVFLIPYDRALLYEVCHNKPEVSYGTS